MDWIDILRFPVGLAALAGLLLCALVDRVRGEDAPPHPLGRPLDFLTLGLGLLMVVGWTAHLVHPRTIRVHAANGGDQVAVVHVDGREVSLAPRTTKTFSLRGTRESGSLRVRVAGQDDLVEPSARGTYVVNACDAWTVRAQHLMYFEAGTHDAVRAGIEAADVGDMAERLSGRTRARSIQRLAPDLDCVVYGFDESADRTVREDDDRPRWKLWLDEPGG